MSPQYVTTVSSKAHKYSRDETQEQVNPTYEYEIGRYEKPIQLQADNAPELGI